MGAGLRLVMLGMETPFARAVLAGLLEAGVPVAGLVLPTAPPVRPVLFPVEVAGVPPTAADLARSRAVTVACLTAGEGLPDLLADPAPDVILVACFPHRLPPEVTRSARLACLNLHPSLLPRYRGPYPLFWQLRAGEAGTGVTLHHLTGRLDAGEVVAQRGVALPDGGSSAELERLLGRAGVGLACDALEAARRGPLPRSPQDEAEATYQPAPGPQDFEVPDTWSARRAFNFMRGTAVWGYPYVVLAGGRRWPVRGALGYHPTGVSDRPCRRVGDHLQLRFSPGLLEVVAEGECEC